MCCWEYLAVVRCSVVLSLAVEQVVLQWPHSCGTAVQLLLFNPLAVP